MKVAVCGRRRGCEPHIWMQPVAHGGGQGFNGKYPDGLHVSMAILAPVFCSTAMSISTLDSSKHHERARDPKRAGVAMDIL